VWWRPQSAVEDDTRQRPFPEGSTRCKQRIVDQHRPRPDSDGVDLGAHTVRVAVRWDRGELCTHPKTSGNPTIEAGRRLEDDERPPLAYQCEEGLIQTGRAFCAETDFDLNPMLAQKRKPAPTHDRIRIFDCGDHARDSGISYPGDARTCSPNVTARLERAVQSCAARQRSSHIECVDLGMRFAGALVAPLPDDRSIR
jgi:hypothetical protein